MTDTEFAIMVQEVTRAVEKTLEGKTMTLDKMCKIMLAAAALLVVTQTDGKIPYEKAEDYVLGYKKGYEI